MKTWLSQVIYAHRVAVLVSRGHLRRYGPLTAVKWYLLKLRAHLDDRDRTFADLVEADHTTDRIG